MNARKTTTLGPSRLPRSVFLGALGAAIAFAALALAGPAAAIAAPVLDVTSTHQPTHRPVPAGTHAIYKVTVSNSGDAATTAPVTLNFTMPAGLKVTAITDLAEKQYEVSIWSCSIAPDSQSASCQGPELFGSPLPIGPGEGACEVEFITCSLIVATQADRTAPLGPMTPTIEACGGGAAACATDPSTTIEIVPFGFRLTDFDGGVLQQNGDPATQAGSHPHTASTNFDLNMGTDSGGFSGEGESYPIGGLKDAAVQLPPGLVGNPQAIETCTEAQLGTSGSAVQCPPGSQVGVAIGLLSGLGGPDPNPYEVGVYNMEVPFGLPGLFGFNILGNVTHIYATVRTDDDYGLTLTAKNAPETLPIDGFAFTFWGVPADPSHDIQRCSESTGGGGFDGCPSPAPLKPFISLPTSCVGPVETSIDVTSWEKESDHASFISHDNTVPISNPIGADGCNAVDFSPTLEAQPTTNVADSPSGLDVDLHIPQNENPGGTAEAHLKDTTVTLPEGLVVNPASANGLDGCSPAEFGLTTPVGTTPIRTTSVPANCPDASKLGTVQVDTPLLEKPMFGAVYIADPYDNPFNSLLSLYVAVDDPKTGIVVKLAGKVTPDPSTGQLTASFDNNPQLPFEDFKLNFFGGSKGALRTPAVCGTYSTTSSLTPWTAPDSGPPATPSDPWAISRGPDGTCANSNGELPNAPSFDAGTVSPIAGAYSPFVVHLRRNDGTQQFSAVKLTPPQGLIGKLAGTPTCPDSALAAAAAKSGTGERANPSCPAASALGSVTAGAGAGPAPYYAPGTAYLTGPYKGAPLSLAIVTPAVAGPFDLGTIVVRTALYVDSRTAQITAVSDPIPSILQGIPLDVRTVDISLDKPQFMLNPTSCDPAAVGGQLTSTLSQTTALSSRFQVGECGRLGFQPKLSLSLKGGTKRAKHPALTAVLQTRPGDANLADISVALPHSEFLDQAHIGTVCTRVQFAADQCPAASIYGEATVYTPLLDYPLTGHVYLRSSNNTLPDLVPDLRGPASQPIKLEAAGRTDSIKGGIRNTFDFVPDAPFSKLVLQLAGGKKGLLQNSTNICRKVFKATVKYGAHNGLAVEARPPLKVASCPKAKKAKKHQRRSHQRGGGRRTVR